MTEEEKI